MDVCSVHELPTKYVSLCTNHVHTQTVDTMLIMFHSPVYHCSATMNETMPFVDVFGWTVDLADLP